MLRVISSRLGRFARREDGTIAVETVLWVPLLLTVLASTFSLHDAFRYKSLNVKAAYTISDALSRETDPIDYAYLDGMVDVMEFLTRSDGPYSLRVTLVRYNDTDGTYVSEWSRTRGAFDALGNRDLEDLYEKLPNMLHNERVIVVETETEYNPPFAVPGLNEARLFYNFGFTRPRFAPKIVWQD
ncbi:TadE/TadG family type IV pilus assembly protein [Ponticoccus sp. (in: a-proteobacteria)]|uniref:TadE/TadG family type IV pilus assembly protein n=1 Tax=Ponticoccus sp. (in: a-proteobacteria) TaxID=1925025 RepID=UPI003AB271B5